MEDIVICHHNGITVLDADAKWTTDIEDNVVHAQCYAYSIKHDIWWKEPVIDIRIGMTSKWRWTGCDAPDWWKSVQRLKEGESWLSLL